VFARGIRAGTALLARSARMSRGRIERLAARVETAASGLADLDERRFDERIAELRGALARRGLADDLIAPGFAVVRETARRTLGTPHYDVQLVGGWVMVQSGLAELETGEGKTLTATLPASLAALAGIPVHVVTANDYLVERDAAEMEPIYTRLGLAVGVALERDADRAARRAAYAHPITYVSNKQLAFDYLRDRIAGSAGRRLADQLGLEPEATAAESNGCSPIAGVADTTPVLRGLCFAIVDEADSVLIDDARTPLILSGPGQPVDEQSVRGALEIAGALERGADFRVDPVAGEITISEAGHHRLSELGANRSGPLAGERRRIEWVHRALCAEHLYERDRDYVVRDDAIQIIDQPTGRRAPDRSFEGSIQSLIEAREGLPLSPTRETLARISYQRFFGRYLRLAGMTGTAREVSRELYRIYGLRTVTIPSRLPSRRNDGGRQLYTSSAQRWQAVVDRIGELHRSGRPVLVGTASVGASQQLSTLLDQAGLPHAVLNAHQDGSEARVIARAGEPGRVTVATRMAGRGTDIQLGEGVAEGGGLAVVASELAEARRIDRQLFGRCGRQGEPGSLEQHVCLEDDLLASQLPPWLLRAAGRRAERLVEALPRLAQWQAERRARLERRRMLAAEEALDDLLRFSGSDG